MPPSIPPPGGVNDASNGGAAATTRQLPLLRQTTTGNSKVLQQQSHKPSSRSAAVQPARRLSQAARNTDISRSSANVLLRSHRKKMNQLRKNKSKLPSRRRQNTTMTRVENDCDDDSTNIIDSPLNPVPESSTTSPPIDTSGLAPYGGISAVSPYGFYGGAASMMTPSPFMGMGMNTMGLPYLSGFNQMVYNVQNIIFSLSQAVHVVGANQEALHHAWESLNQMVENAVATFHEMRALENMERECESEEEQRKRKRLKALRYAFVFGGSWLAYKLIRNLLFRKRNPSLQHGSNPYGQLQRLSNNQSMTSPGFNAISNYSSPNNFYGASNMGYPGYSSNYHGVGNGYY